MPLRVTDRRQRTLERVRLRLRVACGRSKLDAALAGGADPIDDPVLSARAAQLTDLSTRCAIANTIDNLLDAAEEPAAAWDLDAPRPGLQREAVLAARHELLSLAERLREAPSISHRGAAVASLLVWDSASPVYSDQADGAVAAWACAALE